LITEFYKTFKELIPKLLKVFHEIERKATVLNSFYEVLLHSSQNQIRTSKKRELQANLFNEHRRKTPQ
jgi:hypothetical protein